MQCIDPETQQHLANPIDVPLVHVPVQFVLVLVEHHLGWLLALGFALVLHYFVVLGQLDLVRLDHLGNLGLVGLLEAGQHLDQVDRHLEHVLRRSDNLLVPLAVLLEILTQIQLSLAYLVIVLLHLQDPRLIHSLRERLELLRHVLVYIMDELLFI